MPTQNWIGKDKMVNVHLKVPQYISKIKLFFNHSHIIDCF